MTLQRLVSRILLPCYRTRFPAQTISSGWLGRRTFLAAALLLASAGVVGAETVRLLTIGNSFSYNATHYLDQIAAAAGDELVHRPIIVGGASLELHATKAQQHERDPQDKRGRYADEHSLKEALAAEPWDYVTIQQASKKSHAAETYRPYAKQLCDYIRHYATKAEVLLHQTWEYRCDDPRFGVGPRQPDEPASSRDMYRGVSAAYTTIAKELGLRLIPVGDAFHLANEDPQWGFRSLATPPDPATAKPGELPEQAHSLNVGWNWKKQPDGTRKLVYDGHHANLAGEYLGACVWYEVLFGRSAQGNPYVPPGLDPAFATFLQNVAHRAVKAGGTADSSR